MKSFTIHARRCFLQEIGDAQKIDTAAVLALGGNAEDELPQIAQNIGAPGREKGLLLAAFSAEDWNAAFSPWTTDEFPGGGKETLSFLQKNFLPAIREEYPRIKRFVIAGYSLAGLFALWCLTESNMFEGAVSCSGSLWYSEWSFYARQQDYSKKTVYLSLGGKEEKTKIKRMASVGDATRAQYALMKQQQCRCTLQWNPGGHFTDPAGRTAKGIVWLLSHL